ncbi:hypothetical protein M0R45_025867 [Rubus argutus]|uniref:RNA-directed DNA polymerase (Reverse transcriptase) n=1 Tax=Rubus argutus TaxID=59490 RepID=A0AAW1WVY8_RUBAR
MNDIDNQRLSCAGPYEEKAIREECEAVGIRSGIVSGHCNCIRWPSEGDRNTSFLHNMVKIRKLHRPLVSLRVGSIILHDNELISAQVVQQFKKAFTQDTSISNIGLVEKIIPHLVTNDENLMLLALPSMEEITTTVKSMDAYSSPGPDGFGGIFFHHCWDVISNDVINAVQSFFRSGFVLLHFNSNLLTLIPKKDICDQ